MALIACLLFALPLRAQEARDNHRNNILLVPSLHGLHQTNKRYNYDSLQRIIRRFRPDIIAVEIRNEDLDADTFYLQKNYPAEMYRMRYWFPKTLILGIDWVGADIEGRAIPDRYWKEISLIRQYEKLLREDTAMAARCRRCDSLYMERMLLLQNLSLPQLLASQDAALTSAYYRCMEEQLRGSIHRRVLDFYEERNEKILKNIRTILRFHKKQRIVIVTGDDHYFFLKPYFPDPEN